MPSLRDSAVTLDPSRYRQGNTTPTSEPIQHAPVQPPHLVQSPVMISSLPAMATSTDGITRQFYGSGKLPTRRLILPA